MTNEMQTSPEKGEQPILAPSTQLTPSSFTLSASPHVRHPEAVNHIMIWVVIALLPSLGTGVFFFGVKALFLTAVAVVFAVGTEWVIAKMLKAPNTTGDFSAIVTGMLLAFNVSSELPWWMMALGSVFAIGVAKIPFGGLGFNFINPALAGRAFLMASFPAAMTQFGPTRLGSLSGIDSMSSATSGIDAVSSATPLAHFKAAVEGGYFQALDFQEAIKELFTGNVGGCIGETSALALLIGGVILLYKRIIPIRIPLCYIGTVFFLNWIFNGSGAWFTSASVIVPTYQILAGGLFLGAFFMATDMVTSPITPTGKIIFAIGCGLLTFIIRKFGGYPEGVSYSILIMNLFVPIIEQYTRPRIYGEVKTRD